MVWSGAKGPVILPLLQRGTPTTTSTLIRVLVRNIRSNLDVIGSNRLVPPSTLPVRSHTLNGSPVPLSGTYPVVNIQETRELHRDS